MRAVKDLLWEMFHIFFRHYNFPCELKLHRVGNPDANSPVFLSGNYTLTVQRVLRNIRGTDCYLLVANSRGSNVWCAAGMNEFSEYDVIDAINVSGLRDIVRHRRIIAPVYAAPGVDVRAVKEETGFNIHWGPTHLDDLNRFIENGLRRTNDMFQVKFGFQDRLEQALSTALAYTLTIGVGLLFFPAFFAKIIGLVFCIYLFGFCFQPLLPEERRWRRTTLIAAILGGCQVAYGVRQGWTLPDHVLWGAILASFILLMALDGCGSSPLHKTTIGHWFKKGDYDSLFSPVIDPEKCTNCMQCVLVCPKDVFAARRNSVKTVVAVHPDMCEECLACVKQCPTNAIYNRSGAYKGDVKSIPDLHYLMTRDWSHLSGEDRWIGMPTRLVKEVPVVMEEGATIWKREQDVQPVVPPRRQRQSRRV